MKKETIEKLLGYANEAFTANESPDKFARAAAFEAASAAASHYPELLGECADTATLVAATNFVTETTTAACFTARIADAAIEKFAYDRQYLHARQDYASQFSQITASAESKPSCFPLMSALSSAAAQSKLHILQHYETVSNTHPSIGDKAKRAACYVYADTYASTRSAFMRARFIASQIKDQKKQLTAFKKTMQTRLTKDLNYDQIPPGFFLEMMCATSLRIIAGLILLAGVIAIILGCVSIAALPFIPMVVAGSVSTATGTGLLIGSFFARRQHKKLDEENASRMDTNMSI